MIKPIKHTFILDEAVKLNLALNSCNMEYGLLKTSVHIPSMVTMSLNDKTLTIEPKDPNHLKSKALSATTIVLIANALTGFTKPYEITLSMIGVGFKCKLLENNVLDLSLNKSHPCYYKVDNNIKVDIKTPTLILLSSHRKDLLGLTAAQIRRLRPIEPYKGKGIRYLDEPFTAKVVNKKK